MNVVEIDYTDLQGKQFNGFELHLALRERGINANQVVKWKNGNADTVSTYANDRVLDSQIRALEKKYSIQNLLFPYAEELIKTREFQNADIVHYHFIHKGTFSLLDVPELMNQKKSVWTIHDPWIIAGNCVHPLECEEWRQGCNKCQRLNDNYFSMIEDNTAFMWKVKKDILSEVNPDIIVASNFMKQYIEESPITKHFDKIHVIPFGVKTEKYAHTNQKKMAGRFRIGGDKLVIGFRADDAEIKGSRYIYEALRKIELGVKIQLICVGGGSVPDDIKGMYHTTELGWVDSELEMMDFFQSCDLFLMPSLAESFGMMAVEAMASECAVICFQGTVLEEVTNAPDCGISVEYLSSDALASEIVRLAEHSEEVIRRGEKGFEYVKQNYEFDTYVDRHIELYEELAEDNLQ